MTPRAVASIPPPAVSFALLAAFLGLMSGGCGYRWVVEDSPSVFSLAPLINATPEPRLSALLAEAFSAEGRVRPGEGGRILEVAALSLREEPSALTGEDLPRRERLTLEVEWRAGGEAGRETVSRDYPWTADTAALDWARESSLRLLARDAARAVLRRAQGAR